VHSTLPLTPNVDDLFLLCSKLLTWWGFNRSSSNIIDWQFSCLSRFSTNGISLRSDEAGMKKLQRSGQAHFLGASSPDSFPPDRFALRRSRVWLKGEPARKLRVAGRVFCYCSQKSREQNIWQGYLWLWFKTKTPEWKSEKYNCSFHIRASGN